MRLFSLAADLVGAAGLSELAQSLRLSAESGASSVDGLMSVWHL
jgi:hypothetical protein